jgi:hypothetical protein
MKLVRICIYGTEGMVSIDRIVTDEIYFYLLDLEKSFDQEKRYAPKFIVTVINDFQEKESKWIKKL